ncbi:recombination regulator RecX [soil metagenome]
MKITALQPQTRNAERVNLHVDGAFRLALAAEIAYGAHLHVGDSISEATLRELEARDQAWKAREAALVLLSFRPRTAAELRRRLLRKDFPEEIVDSCVTSLVDQGLVNDGAFAEMFVRDRVRLRPKGKHRLVQELRAKGVDPEEAQEAITEVFEREEVAESELARVAAAKWRPRAGEERPKARARLHAFLARRGFGGDAIREVMAEMLP